MATEPQLLIDSAVGQYIPQEFARLFPSKALIQVPDGTWDKLIAGPNAPEYEEAWDDVLDWGRVKTPAGVFSIYQDGDVWLIPDGMEWSESEDWFIWPNKEE